MRLTLRTLLAYMDDILEPADHEDLGKKIEASDFATELIHRSRDTVRRLRLGAPPVLATDSDDVLDALDMGDANAVAEYLDNTLPPEQVADFERMCLETGTTPDMHLAEVASCHHVLTMVLGEPAAVDSALKQRIYNLTSEQASGQKLRIEPTHVAAALSAETAPPVQAAPVSAPPIAQPASYVEPELPDYLREAAESKRRSRNWAIAITLLVMGGIGIWLAVPQKSELPAEVGAKDKDYGEGNIAIQLDGNEGTAGAAGATTSGDSDTMAPAPPFDPADTADAPAPAFEPGGASDPTEPAPPFDPSANNAAPAPQETETDPSPAAGLAAGETELPMVDAEIPVAVADATRPVGVVPPTPPIETEQTDTVVEPVASGEEPVLIASTPDRPMPSEVPQTPVEAIEAEQSVSEPAQPRRLGNYLGNNDVLLIHNPSLSHWLRMPPRSPISTGADLLTMPKFFTHVVLADVNTYLSGGTRVRLPIETFDGVTSESALNLEVVYGRVMFNSGLDGSKVAILVDDQLREFHLDGSSSVAVDVQRMFVPGNDYENEAAPTIATWYLTSGSVEWPTATGGMQKVRGEMMWRTIDGVDEIPEPVSQLPDWIGREPLTDMERSARADLSKELKEGQPVEIRLQELTDGKGLGRRKEVRVIAAASSIYVGQFELLVRALDDSDQARGWDDHIRDLRQAVALSPDVAASVRDAFVKIRGEQAAQDLFEMVEGYNAAQVGTTPETVRTGALAQLIKWLDHERLDYRVLAISNIRSITGKNKVFRPDDSLKGRKKNLRRIIAEFEADQLLEL